MTHSWQHTLAGAIVTGWDSTRETGELGDTWSWEKRWAATGLDPDSLWTGQRVGLCGKLGAVRSGRRHTRGLFSKKELSRDLAHAAARPVKWEEWECYLLPFRVSHG